MTILGDLSDFTADPLAAVRARLLESDVRQPVPIRLAHRRAVLVARPDAFRHVLVTARDRYDKGAEVARLRVLFGDSVLTARGDEHPLHRARVRERFQPARLREGLNRALERLTADACRDTRVAGRSLAEGATFDAVERATRLTVRMGAAALFGASPDDTETEVLREACGYLHRHLSDTMWQPVDLAPYLPSRKGRRLREAVAEVRGLAWRLARQGDLPEQLRPTGATPEDDREMVDELVTLLVSGFETTATTAAWLIYALASRPELAHRVRAETDAVLGAAGEELSGDTVGRFPRTGEIVEEVLRCFPSAWWFARTALVDDEIAGVPVGRGQTVLLCPWALHRQADLWPEPERFDPGRALSGRRPSDPFAFLPFGAGARTCIGKHLALPELTAIAVLAVAGTDLEALAGDIEEQRPRGGVTLAPPAEGLPVRATLRLSASALAA